MLEAGITTFSPLKTTKQKQNNKGEWTVVCLMGTSVYIKILKVSHTQTTEQCDGMARDCTYYRALITKIPQKYNPLNGLYLFIFYLFYLNGFIFRL